MSPVLLMILAAALCGSATIQGTSPSPPGRQETRSAEDSPFLIDRGKGLEPIEIPRDEELVFEVEIDVGILGDIEVGTVTLSSGVEPYKPGLPPSTANVKPEPPRSVGWIRSQARGSYLGYELKHDLDVRHLPQTWPKVFLRDTQTGSENRRRELKLGILDEKETAIFRNDGHCRGCSNPEHFIESAWAWGEPYHCKKCKRADHRVWSEPHTRAIPPGTVDLLSGVYLARAMILKEPEKATFPVLDKLKLWTLTVHRGTRKVIETPAGNFDCMYVQLSTAIPDGEPRDDKRFQGLFGIQGSIKIWLEASTGVPVTISGELPVPVIGTLDLNIRLKSFRGTPAGFKPKR